MRRRLVLVLACALVAAPAHADWEVKRGADDPRVVDALLGALLRAPDDRGALRRLLAHARGPAIAKAAARCDARAKGIERLACGELHREAGHVDEALARFRSVAADAPADPRAHRAAAELLARQSRFDEAVPAYTQALAHTTGAARAPLLEALLTSYGAARTPSEEERRARASEVATELRALRPADAVLGERVAEALLRVGAVDPAARLFGELAAATHDPLRKVPLLFRAADAAEGAKRDEEALHALEAALALLPRTDSRRREALQHVVLIERRRERLPELARRWSELPDARRDATVEALLGQILDELGDGARARAHLERAIALDPRDLAPRRLLIRLYSRAGDDDAAIAALRKLVAASHGDPRLALELAEKVYARPGGEKEGLALAAELGRRHDDATTHAALAALYDKWGRSELAIAEQARLVRTDPNPEHLIALGELYDQAGDKDAAKKTWRRLAPKDDAPLEQRLRLAEVLAEHDQAGEALVILERANHAHPDDANIERHLADVFDRLRRDDEAEAIYRKLLDAAIARDDASAVQAMGARWIELTRRAKGGRPIEKLLALAEEPRSPARVELAFVLARLWLQAGRVREAERLFGRVAAVAAKGADRARALEAAAELVGTRLPARAAEAIELLLHAAKEDPSRAALFYGKASARAAELYRDEDALRFAERAVAVGPLDPDAQERLGALLESRDPARALAAYDRALELDGGRDRLRLRTAELALRRGDGAGAAARYRALLARARDEQALEEASRRAVVVHELTGRLGELEREIAPRASAPAVGQGALGGARPLLRRLLLEVEARYVPVLSARADAGDAAARAELARVSTHALAPLLDAILDGDRAERASALSLLAQLGSPQAAPLLLRLAAGETARRGSEPPSTELRIAAAQAAIALAPAGELPRIVKLSGDREHKIRLAAASMLARLAHEPAAVAQLGVLLDDEHARVATVACLGLAEAAPSTWPSTAWPKLVALSLDDGTERAAACATTVARRVEQAPELASPLADRLRAHKVLSAGAARVLLAGADEATMGAALARILSQPDLRAALAGDAVPAVTARGDDAADAATTVAIRVREAERYRGARSARAAQLVTAGVLALLHTPTAAIVLEDLAAPDALLPRLAARGTDDVSIAAARADLLDRAAPALGALLAQSAASRSLALVLLAERPEGVADLARALDAAATRRMALAALAGSRAAVLDETRAAPLVQPLRAALVASDWRERRGALVCLAHHPSLGSVLGKEARGLRRDPNPLVAEAASAFTD